jgi:hypothetical protein
MGESTVCICETIVIYELVDLSLFFWLCRFVCIWIHIVKIIVLAVETGKLYAVLGKRGGRILHGDLQEGSTNFEVTAQLPVVESFDFANEVRRQTSGLALPQLVFSGWEVSIAARDN